MAFLIILIVATAVLLAWLLVQLARLGLGELRVPRLRESSVQGAAPSGSPVPPVGGSARDRARGAPEADRGRREGDQARSRRPQRRQERVLYDESDVEQAVRDRLYGRRGRRD